MTEVTVVIGAGSIGQVIARRVSAGKHVVRHIAKQPDTRIKPVCDDIDQASVRHTLDMDLWVVLQKAGHDVAYQQHEGRLGRTQTYQARRRVALGFRPRPRDGKQGSHHADP